MSDSSDEEKIQQPIQNASNFQDTCGAPVIYLTWLPPTINNIPNVTFKRMKKLVDGKLHGIGNKQSRSS
jgi:hypothetical protein